MKSEDAAPCVLMRYAQLCSVLISTYVFLGIGHGAETSAPKVDLRSNFDCRQDEVQLTFAQDGLSLCVAWWPHTRAGNPGKDPLDFLVFDTSGGLLRGSTATNQTEMLKNFPQIGCRKLWQGFLTNAEGWAFAGDLSQGLRILQSADLESVAEFWALPPGEKPLWIATLPNTYRPAPAKPLVDPEDKTIVVLTSGQNAIVLDRGTGEVRRSFTLGPIESDAEVLKRKKRFGLKKDDSDPALRFSAFAVAQDPDNNRRLLACGAFFDKRVRVIQMDSPGRVLFEANTEVNPALPKGGTWTVQRVEFLSGGKYLLAEYYFGGRGTDLILEPTEVFDTVTWRIVWQENDIDLRKVTLSPDGKLMAFLRGNTLEIHRFEPGAPAQKK